MVHLVLLGQTKQKTDSFIERTSFTPSVTSCYLLQQQRGFEGDPEYLIDVVTL